MHANARPPIFVPPEFRSELEQLSKAALMDVVWDYCIRAGETPAGAMESFRQTREIIEHYRNDAKREKS